MGREVAIMGDDEIELSLELSIGGSYGYAKSGALIKPGEKTGDFSTFVEKDDRIDNPGVSRSDFAGDVGSGNGFCPADLEARREIQDLRREEARIKTEERVKKSTGVDNGGVFLEDKDKLVLEAQQFRARVHEREAREREWVSGSKREKNGTKEAVQDLNISLFTENGDNSGNNGYTGRVEVLPVRMNVVRAVPENGGRNCDMGKWAVAPLAPAVDGSLEPCSPAVSNYHSLSHKGGNDSNTGSNKVDLKENDHSCSSERIKKPKLETHSSNETSSTVDDPTTPISKDTNASESIKKPPKPSTNHRGGASIQRFPCVSTTGNGPNGKTITGFLYKYSATEVSIMCVCHGSSFSPAGFVEHAGGVEVTNPLRHITIVATKSAS